MGACVRPSSREITGVETVETVETLDFEAGVADWEEENISLVETAGDILGIPDTGAGHTVAMAGSERGSLESRE